MKDQMQQLNDFARRYAIKKASRQIKSAEAIHRDHVRLMTKVLKPKRRSQQNGNV